MPGGERPCKLTGAQLNSRLLCGNRYFYVLICVAFAFLMACRDGWCESRKGWCCVSLSGEINAIESPAGLEVPRYKSHRAGRLLGVVSIWLQVGI